MAAVEVDQLDVFQVGAAGCFEGGREHAGVEVIDDVEQAEREVRRVDLGQGVRRQHGDAQVREVAGQVVVDERVVLVGAAGEHHGIAAARLDLLHDLQGAGLQLGAEGELGGVCLLDRLAGELFWDAEAVAHPRAELALAVLGRVPVPQRGVEGHAPAALGVV